MGKIINVKIDVKIPLVPVFLRYPDGCISIADITDEGLKEIGKAWTEELLKKANERRKENDKSAIGNRQS